MYIDFFPNFGCQRECLEREKAVCRLVAARLATCVNWCVGVSTIFSPLVSQSGLLRNPKILKQNFHQSFVATTFEDFCLNFFSCTGLGPYILLSGGILQTYFPYQSGPSSQIFCAGALYSAHCPFRTQKVSLNCLITETGDTQRQNCLQKLKGPVKQPHITNCIQNRLPKKQPRIFKLQNTI